MKKLLILAGMVLTTTGSFAQPVDLRRKIEVSGVAEKEVTPDIIDVSISLKEYMDNGSKTNISQLEDQLEGALKEAGVPREDFSVNNVSAYNYQLQKKKNSGLLASKQYSIRFHDLDKFNRIISSIDPKGIESTNITNLDYSKKVELKKQLLIEALLAARNKAEYLLGSIGEKTGRALDINETDSGSPEIFRRNLASLSANTVLANNYTPDLDIGIKKIKLSVQVNAIFEIAD